VCKEPIDRIWAVLGLFHPQLREAILSIGCIDYSLIGKTQFWRSYIDLGKWVIVRDETLGWLSMAASEKPPECLHGVQIGLLQKPIRRLRL
jgi:hypothetical protein